MLQLIFKICNLIMAVGIAQSNLLIKIEILGDNIAILLATEHQVWL